VDWEVAAFAADFGSALRFVRERCDRVLALTAPLALGRPAADANVPALNAAVQRAAAEQGALIVDLSSLRARNQVMVDRVHPTAFGQIAIAERALAVLERDGLTARVLPSSLIQFQTTWRGRLRGDLTYAYRGAKLSGLELLARLR
jgi:hypothetical protein